MNEKKLKELWQNAKEKWSDPDFRMKVYQETAGAVIYAFAVGAVAYAGYRLAYRKGYRKGAGDRFATDNLSFALMKESGFIIFDESKEDAFVELLKQNGYHE